MLRPKSTKALDLGTAVTCTVKKPTLLNHPDPSFGPRPEGEQTDQSQGQ